MITDCLAWFAIGTVFGLALCGWPWHHRFSRYNRSSRYRAGPVHGQRHHDQGGAVRGLSWAASNNDPISIKQRLPASDDLEPKTRYCWWFNIDNDTWLYGDASALGDPWRYWLPHHAKPIPPGNWIVAHDHRP